MPFIGRVLLEPVSAKTWRKVQPFRYQGRDEPIDIEAGETDLTSVPGIVPPIIAAKTGAHLLAALLHDELWHRGRQARALDRLARTGAVADAVLLARALEIGAEVYLDRRSRSRVRPKIEFADADGLFRRVMRELDEEARARRKATGRREPGVPWWRRWLMWAAVRWASILGHQGWRGTTLADWGRLLLVTSIVASVVVALVVGQFERGGATWSGGR